MTERAGFRVTEPLLLPDQVELAVRQLDEVHAAYEAAKSQAKANIAQLIEQAKPLSREVIAEIYWRFEAVPSTLLWPAGAVFVARDHPYWWWTCPRCGSEVPVRSREELKKLRSAARERIPVECGDCRKRSQAGNAARWSAERARQAAREQELRTMPYREYLQTPEWQERRKAALKRAKYACQVCNRQRQLHVHHRTYERRGVEFTADLIVLCDECHALYHRKGLLAAHSGSEDPGGRPES